MSALVIASVSHCSRSRRATSTEAPRKKRSSRQSGLSARSRSRRGFTAPGRPSAETRTCSPAFSRTVPPPAEPRVSIRAFPSSRAKVASPVAEFHRHREDGAQDRRNRHRCVDLERLVGLAGARQGSGGSLRRHPRWWRCVPDRGAGEPRPDRRTGSGRASRPAPSSSLRGPLRCSGPRRPGR